MLLINLQIGIILTILELILILTLVVSLLLLVLERGDKLIVSMTGAGISIALGVLPYWTVGGVANQTLLPEGINSLLSKIEPDLMFIIIGMTLLVGVTAETGIYELIAIKIIKLSHGNQTKLMLYLSLLSMLFAAFLDAYMAIIIIGTITLVSANVLFREADNEPINPKPFLLAEALFANVGGMLTRVASPPNLILGAHFQIPFLDFSVAMFPVVVLSAIGTFFILEFFFRKDLHVKISQHSIDQLMNLDENNVIRDPKLLRRAIVIILLTIIGFFLSSFAGDIKIELGYIALAGGFSAVALVSGKKPDETLHHIEWSVVFFYAGLLTMVGLVEQAHLLEPLVQPIEYIFDFNPFVGLGSIVIFNVVISSVLDNIPMAAIMTGVIDGLGKYLGFSLSSSQIRPMVWAAVIGTNAGGNVTPIASAAGVQVVQILNRERETSRHISFFEFFKIGVLVAMVPVVIGIAYVILVAKFFYGW